MFEDVELEKSCMYCNKVIKSMPVQDVNEKLRFCDLVCAKLYYDNVDKFTIDINRYNNYFNNGELSRQANDIYSKIRWFMFEQLPQYITSDPPEQAIKTYKSILNPTLFKSIGINDK